MFKKLNIPGIMVLVVALLAAQFGVGLVISPMLAPIISDALNKGAGAKVAMESVSVWPVTMSFSVKGLEVFDPDDPSTQIVGVKKASFRLSLWALLSKRIVIARLSASGVDVNVEGESDGTFNIQKLGGSTEAEKTKGPGSLLDGFKAKKDWFGRIYEMLKKKQTTPRDKKEVKEASKIIKTVQAMPKGRKVRFESIRDHIFEIRELDLSGVKIHMTQGGASADMEDARVRIRGLAIDPGKPARIRSVEASGKFSSAGVPAGGFKVSYDTSYKGNVPVTDVDVKAADVDLAALKFLYADSLPVTVVRGKIDISSRTAVNGEALDSRNKIELEDHELAVKSGSKVSAGFMPMPTLIEAMNQVQPLKMNFEIKGTVDNPEFTGFEDTLKELVKPYIENIGKNIEKQGMNMLEKMIKKDTGVEAASDTPAEGGEDTTKQAIDAVKSLFGSKK